MANDLIGKKILLGITGSISAYKTPYLVRELIKAGAEVKTILTPSAGEFVAPLALESVSKNPVIIDMFDKNVQNQGAWHIQLAHWCDLAIIAPCTASTLGKLANGIADNALVTVMIALPKNKPLLIAPAMDVTMFNHPSTQRNIELLKHYGTVIIPPESGELASGLIGAGRLPDFSIIINEIMNALNSKQTDNNISAILNKSQETLDEAVEKIKFNTELELEFLKQNIHIDKLKEYYKGKKVLITAGPTIENIDPVRYISNHSSGKMGVALAEAANSLGAEVILIAGPISINTSESIKRINVQTAEEMYNEVIKEFPECDIAIMAAAVADYTPKEKYTEKIKKSANQESLTIELIPTKDILAEIGRPKKNNQTIVGFALETENAIENGRQKLIEKNADIILINSAVQDESVFGSDYNSIIIVDRKGNIAEYGKMEKKLYAYRILQYIKDYRTNSVN